ncbi:MAG: hypothetical protein HY731_12685 [Candidatus Tectomicrobia bacterium]|nr:hypothetical protein [Candidatus Tectomicrobia bacterium]
MMRILPLPFCALLLGYALWQSRSELILVPAIMALVFTLIGLALKREFLFLLSAIFTLGAYGISLFSRGESPDLIGSIFFGLSLYLFLEASSLSTVSYAFVISQALYIKRFISFLKSAGISLLLSLISGILAYSTYRYVDLANVSFLLAIVSAMILVGALVLLLISSVVRS